MHCPAARAFPLLALLLGSVRGQEHDWRAFRGTDGSATSAAAVARTWSDEDNILWRTPLGGRGTSSPIIVGDQTKTFIFWKRLFEAGVYVNQVIPPAAPAGKELIRTSLMATHSRDQLDRALDILATIGRELEIIPRSAQQPAARQRA